MSGTLLAQEVEHALNFLAQECGIEFGEGGGLDLHRGFIQPRPCATDSEALLVQELTYAPDKQDFMVLVITAVAAALYGLELGEFLLPVTQNMRLHAAKLAYLTDGEVALRGDRG